MKFYAVAAISILLIFGSNVTASEFEVVGPKIVEVGQVGHFMLLDEKGKLAFMPDEDCPRGCVLIDGGDVEFLENDGNALSVSVKFIQQGNFSIWFKNIGIPIFKISVK